MPCFRPMQAYQHIAGGRLVWSAKRDCLPITVPCSRCIGCRQNHAAGWQFRIMAQAQMHPFGESSFVTLTYRPEAEPQYGSLFYPHVQQFIRALRFQYPDVKVSFYCVGEYGPTTDRPHYHLCIFGVGFRGSRTPVAKGPSGHLCYSTPELSRLWPHGFSSVGDLTVESAAYVARHHINKINGPMAEAKYQRVLPETGEVIQLVPEFSHMSRRPGIGASWFAKWGSDVFPRDGVIRNGKQLPAPRYFFKLLERTDEDLAEWVKAERYKKSFVNFEHTTPARLAVREKCAILNLARGPGRSL